MAEKLPRAVRRELLLARAAVERIEAARALRDLRRARGPLRVVGETLGLSGFGSAGLAGNVVAALSLVRRHPYLGSIASVAFGALQGSKIGRWTRRLGVLAALAAGGVWVAGRYSRSQRDSKQPTRAETRSPLNP